MPGDGEDAIDLDQKPEGTGRTLRCSWQSGYRDFLVAREILQN